MRVAQKPSAAIGKDRYITGVLHGQIPPIRRELGITNCGMGLGCFSKCERIQPRPDSYQGKAAAFCESTKAATIFGSCEKAMKNESWLCLQRARRREEERK